MNRPRGRAKCCEKRQQIINSATKLFLSQGFDGTSMEKVALSAGASKQTVYSHFGNKEELFSEVVEAKCQQHQLTEELFETDRPAEEVLLELAVHLTDLLLTDDAIRMHRICVANAGHRSRISEMFWAAGPNQLNARLTRYLARQTKSGALNIDNQQYAAQQFLCMAKGEAQCKQILGLDNSKNLDELDEYLRSCVAMFIAAYGPETV
ncbi:MAG: TetR/AcrR family transcriptional regulator [Halieaceae bacterium]|nr:TetR/AcrR family transcriptional regulator [Halieaceae bacterium]